MDNPTTPGIKRGSSEVIVTSAASIATSVLELPKAIPTFAYDKAGASFIPSPIIITFDPID